jgi:CYTH domain-containing protein
MSADDIRHPDAPAGKARKYAQPERERRFLLAGLPPGDIVRSVALTDLYLPGTRLRLRRAVDTADGGTIYKLTQKVPAADGGPGLITTVYLDAVEYERLATVPALELRKTRHSMPPFGVDVFAPPLHGLFLAEREFSSDEDLHAFAPPPFALAEVTSDPRFAGGRLVVTARDELLRTLASFGLGAGGV